MFSFVSMVAKKIDKTSFRKFQIVSTQQLPGLQAPYPESIPLKGLFIYCVSTYLLTRIGLWVIPSIALIHICGS